MALIVLTPAELLVQLHDAVLELKALVVHKVLSLESLKVTVPVAVGETEALKVTVSPIAGLALLTV
jgi:hypothetical protein